MTDGNQGNEHPFLDFNNIKSQLTIEEMQLKLKNINERLTVAMQLGNQQLINQLTMARTTYLRAYSETLSESIDNTPTNIGKIDIS